MNKTEYDEKALLAKAKKGDGEAFGELVLHTQALVYNLALRIMKNEQDALDMSQEAYLRAYRSLTSFEGGCSFSSWMYTITRNVCIDRLKKLQKQSAYSLTQPDTDGDICELDIADSSSEPDRIYEKKERASALYGAIERLTPIQREILILYDIEGFSYSEIAEALSIDMGTVKSRLFRAREKLRSILSATEHYKP